MEFNDKKPKILFVANLAKEHILKFHVPTIKMLKDEGWHVDVACSGNDAVPYCDRQFEMSYKRSPFNLALFKGIKELKKIINEGEYDIVYCHTPVGGVAARIASRKARKKGTKVVYMAHGHYFYKGGPLIYWLLFYPIEKMLSRYTDSIVLINKEDYELTKRKFKHKKNTYLIDGIGLNLNRFNIQDKETIRKQYREELNIPQNAIVLVYLAELIKNKNQKMLIRILKNVIKEKENVYLVLAGIDHWDGEVQKYASENGVLDNVRFLGWRSDIVNIYAMSDICTASSIREGFGINIVEAMASNLAVIATDNRGHRTIINDNETGYLIPLDNEKEFEKTILNLISDEILRNKIINNATNNIEKYSQVAILQKIKEILNEHL